MKNIHILQEESGGIPDTPQLFLTEKEAENAFVSMVNGTKKRKFKTYKGASAFLDQEWDGNQEYCIRFWSIELPEKKTIVYLKKGK